LKPALSSLRWTKRGTLIKTLASPRVFCPPQVRRISYATNSASLRHVFERYGDVEEANLALDKDTGYSRGFAFVVMKWLEGAQVRKRLGQVQRLICGPPLSCSPACAGCTAVPATPDRWAGS
jgi:hypothetical protein